MALQKYFTVNIYSPDGTFLREISNREYGNLPSIRSQINGGQGELILTLSGDDFKFGNFGEDDFINAMNIVVVQAVKVDDTTTPPTQDSTTIYKGFISMYTPQIDQNGGESLEITILGLVSLLSASYYKNGTNYSVVHTNNDPSDIIKDIIDHFNTIFGGSLVSYSGGHIDTVGTTVSNTFEDQKWFEAITDAAKLAGPNWSFYVDMDGQVWFRQKPSTATHLFTIGLDVASVKAPKTMESVINDVQARYSSGATSDYDDATSQAEFGTGSPPTGKWSNILYVSNITDASGAAAVAEREVENNKSMKVKATIVINSEYDLESIKPGDTCKVVNINGTSVFDNNMLITDVTYSGDFVTISVAEEPSDFAIELKKLVG